MSKRDSYLRRTYGITEAEFDLLVQDTGGKCPICLKAPKTWVVDHDHGRSKRVRGVCCTACNFRVIGRHRDPALFTRTAQYLTEFPVDRVLGPRTVPQRTRRKSS